LKGSRLLKALVFYQILKDPSQRGLARALDESVDAQRALRGRLALNTFSNTLLQRDLEQMIDACLKKTATVHSAVSMNKAFIIVLLCLLPTEISLAQEWPYYGGDAGGMRYSPLAQINRSNVQRLQVAWTYHTGDLSDGSIYPVRSAFECTPLVVDGVMYLTTPFNRVIALDSETGKERWAFDPKLDKNKPNNLFINRGVAFARLGKEQRVFLGTLDGRLFALDARDGQPVKSFGNGGFIDLRVGVADKFPNRLYGMTSPPVVYKDLLIDGSVVPYV